MGDDIPRHSGLRQAGLSAAPKDAVQEVLDTVDYISHKKGGETCVRDVSRTSLACARGKWTFNLKKNETVAN